jgi:hypothetical protein
MEKFDLTKQEKDLLIDIARKAIEDGLNKKGDNYLYSEELLSKLTDNLKKNAGVFVTLKALDVKLRGCIGNFISNVALYANVYNMAQEAAFADPRFRPLSKSELEEIKIEISVLTPLEKITDLEKIEIGRHGLYLIKGPYHGVLLPQVAVEYNMDRKAFLEAVSQKAGLPPDAYKNSADLYIFSALIFGE